ncbi:hypothetical protein GGR56DRAFT_683754 [Xylariaceae sp. FL0804]|nr:hypothetical protein GGR56DRAFT_683754 [Xylariaceae sp. FL0804]
MSEEARLTHKPSLYTINEAAPFQLPSTFSPWPAGEQQQQQETAREDGENPSYDNDTARTTATTTGNAAPSPRVAASPRMADADAAAAAGPAIRRISSSSSAAAYAPAAAAVRELSPLTPDLPTARQGFPPSSASSPNPEVVVSAPPDTHQRRKSRRSSTGLSEKPQQPAAATAAATAAAMGRRTRFREMLSRSSSVASAILPPRQSASEEEEVEEEGSRRRRGQGGGPTTDADADADTPPPSSSHEAYAMTSVDALQPLVDSRSSSDYGDDDDDGDAADRFSLRYAQAPLDCHSRRDVHIRRRSGLYVTLMVLSVYSTGLSGLWFVTAILQPRYGEGISSSRHWRVKPSTATLVCTLFAKTIEMTFVTVFVAVLGQILTRRAFSRKSHGITLAEMTMRNWVVQPGSLFTYWQNIPSAGATILGALSLLATIAALLYTTASDAMVSPKLSMGSWHTTDLQGLVQASYSNPYYVEASCQTPIDKTLDPLSSAFSCLDVQYSGQCSSLMSDRKEWKVIHHSNYSTLDTIDQRPVAKHNLYDNTTMVSAWIEGENSDTPSQFAEFGRVINNVTLAMPHPGVYAAATDPKNKILQPSDLSGLGQYSIRASVVSPAVNVMCVNMNASELAPLVYTTWPDARTEGTEIPGQKIGVEDWYADVPEPSATEWLNDTVVDDIFHWGEKYGRRPPVFQLYPIDYNMITNTTVSDSDSIYILSKGNNQSSDYTLCDLRSWVTPSCSTRFNISGLSGAYMTAHCEDAGDANAYARADPVGARSTPDPSVDWKNTANEWALSINLNAGTENSNASNARILTDLALRQPRLDPLLPSMAEALAVLATSTLVQGAVDSTYRSTWKYGLDNMQLSPPGVYEGFRAELQTQQYASSHDATWQAAVFYPVLGAVFLLNLLCLLYLLLGAEHPTRWFTCFSKISSNRLRVDDEVVRGSAAAHGLVTDYTEPKNLFAVAVNSPPSRALAGSCGHGPDAADMRVAWRVGYAPGPNHYFLEDLAGNGSSNSAAFASGTDLLAEAYEGASGDGGEGGKGGRKTRGGQYGKSYHRLSSSRTWL